MKSVIPTGINNSEHYKPVELLKHLEQEIYSKQVNHLCILKLTESLREAKIKYNTLTEVGP